MDKLDEIMKWKRDELSGRIRHVKERELSNLASVRLRGPSFRESLSDLERLSVVAEIKRKSPSAGIIAAEVESAEKARNYYNAEADAISVLTDSQFFSGSLKDLWEVNDFLQSRDDARPTLRKDFFIHPIQIVESAEAGSSAVLLIVRALSDREIQELYEAASLASLDCLFEVHNEQDLERAIRFNARIIGVNNRDLTRFETDLSVSERLIPQIPENIVSISESGILSLEDAERVRNAGADAVLIGEALMKLDEPEIFIHELHQL
ncbi:MAG: Indole-3-glycerol phosphate synthase [Candidatus Moanabacter tarae]|uniref:Indole-3-glycerol phosphate synthase n=1 Tax=Candidatus Moanibacter tarae TaxID=2200854 RepID=A0A2Z4ACA5_9BACT|nr:MAG: Indole-3-glycerol phosphate synthase [Candidatus Moanabacter tarae]|tara:strand:+ start:7198 stop:7992 length:795 start_codon:yes stop_codon:yes gene_type:complete